MKKNILEKEITKIELSNNKVEADLYPKIKVEYWNPNKYPDRKDIFLYKDQEDSIDPIRMFLDLGEMKALYGFLNWYLNTDFDKTPLKIKCLKCNNIDELDRSKLKELMNEEIECSKCNWYEFEIV